MIAEKAFCSGCPIMFHPKKVSILIFKRLRKPTLLPPPTGTNWNTDDIDAAMMHHCSGITFTLVL
jgi:hypothetical protein